MPFEKYPKWSHRSLKQHLPTPAYVKLNAVRRERNYQLQRSEEAFVQVASKYKQNKKL